MSVQTHFDKLVRDIGPRPLGSAAHRQAMEYAVNALEQSGLRVSKQRFPCMQWRDGGASLRLDGAPVAARPAPYAAPCDASGELVCLDTAEALLHAELRGKIALLRGALAAEELAPKDNPFWYPDEHRALIEKMENARLLAVLTAGLPDGDAPMIDDGAFAVPCAVVARADAERLRDGMRAHLRLDTERGETEAYNVTALLGDAPRRVCFCAHLDTKAFTPGALDDASGSAVVLALAEALRDEKLPFAVEFTLFSGEDNYANDGELLYLRESLAKPERYLWAANIDGVGMPGCDTTVALFDCPDALAIAARGLLGAGWSEMEPWPQGDHTLFAMKGVPALALTSRDIFTAPLHSAEDNADGVAAVKLQETVAYLRALTLEYARLR